MKSKVFYSNVSMLKFWSHFYPSISIKLKYESIKRLQKGFS